MATLLATRGHQDVLVAEFVFNYNDKMINTAGNLVDFGETNPGGAAGAFDIINLPPNSIVVGGSFWTDTTFDTAGYDVIIGDSGSTNRYFTTKDVKTASATAEPFLLPNYLNTGGLNLRFTFASDDVCTAGKMTIRVQYVIRGRTSEIVPT